jgi:ElaB/YqjD/DUF883 family membrane-anchored ribosome-binding protein
MPTAPPPVPSPNLRHELDHLLTETEAVLNGSLSETSTETMQHLRDRLEAARQRLATTYADVKDSVVQGARCTDTAIREHPYQSLALAGGAGLLLGVFAGALLARRHD